jgi:PadR family transcriptional regulator, regulatory protein PadR
MNEILKGHLDMLLLSALEHRPLHGYGIIERLRARSEGFFDLPEGTIYPALHRLEASGVLRSDWSETEGRRRRVYSLTTRGKAALSTQRKIWHSFSRAVGAVAGVKHG